MSDTTQHKNRWGRSSLREVFANAPAQTLAHRESLLALLTYSNHRLVMWLFVWTKPLDYEIVLCACYFNFSCCTGVGPVDSDALKLVFKLTECILKIYRLAQECGVGIKCPLEGRQHSKIVFNQTTFFKGRTRTEGGKERWGFSEGRVGGERGRESGRCKAKDIGSG